MYVRYRQVAEYLPSAHLPHHVRVNRAALGVGLAVAFGMTLVANFPVCALIGSRVVSVLDSGAERPGFKSQSRRCRGTVVGKLFTPIVPLFTKKRNW